MKFLPFKLFDFIVAYYYGGVYQIYIKMKFIEIISINILLK